jgi:hypothetical protein
MTDRLFKHIRQIGCRVRGYDQGSLPLICESNRMHARHAGLSYATFA